LRLVLPRQHLLGQASPFAVICLLLLGGTIYIAFGSRCEDPGKPMFHGWILGYDANTLQQTAGFQVTSGGIDGGGIWQAGSGLASDGQSIYATTGNRRPSEAIHPNDVDWADSVIRIEHQFSLPQRTFPPTGPTFGHVLLSVADYFTPYRKVWLDAIDLDLGSSGPVVIPNSDLLVTVSKQGILYVIDRTNMGKLDVAKAWTAADLANVFRNPNASPVDFPEDFSADHVVQKFQVGFNQYHPANQLRMNDWPAWPHTHGSPVFAQFQDGSAMLYIWPEKDHLKAFPKTGNRFDDSRKILGVDAHGQLLLDPDGMPG